MSRAQSFVTIPRENRHIRAHIRADVSASVESGGEGPKAPGVKVTREETGF